MTQLKQSREAIFMQEAIKLAKEGMQDGLGGPFGAIVVKNDKIVGVGSNQVVRKQDPTCHAEIMAIRDACKNLKTFILKGCTVYTSCEPCPMCLAALYWARVDNVIFACTHLDASKAGFDDSLIYCELAKPVEKRQLPMSQILRNESLQIFKQWSARSNKVSY